ncbi:hypothetical protein AB1N83_012781 [Pleurotus pulmonarius]
MVWFGSLAQVCRSYSNNPRQPASQINNDDAQPPCERTARPGQVYTMRQRARSLRIRPLFACKVPTAALHDDSQIGCAATEIVSSGVGSLRFVKEGAANLPGYVRVTIGLLQVKPTAALIHLAKILPRSERLHNRRLVHPTRKIPWRSSCRRAC